MRVPKLHQSTALPCPLRVKTSGALKMWSKNEQNDLQVWMVKAFEENKHWNYKTCKTPLLEVSSISGYFWCVGHTS